jgi:peptidoglycan/xylan/chitin deacetylase (PgdA/CDA1 family)
MTHTNHLRILSTLILLTVIAAACAPAATPQPTPDMDAALTQVVATLQAGGTQTAEYIPPIETSTPAPTVAPTSTRDPNRTPPALPVGFTTSLLNPLDTPHTYIQDTCQALKAKWDPNNSVPGTVVMPIMFHSITKSEVTQDSQISITDFRKMMNDLHDMGFEAVNMQQAADFLYKNAKIPQRSVLLIVDDRKYREYFDKTFKNFYDQWGWKVVNAWISHPDTTQQLWDENAALEAEGWVDHQAHGVIHNINMDNNSSDDYLKGELQGSIDAMQAHFNKTPIAIIWPGGNFGIKPVQAARQYGYKLGFTINPRGPIMYNWVPQTDAADPARPSFIPEGPAGDPLMTLPRYWDTDARAHIDTVRNISNEAVAYAEKNKAAELEYYDIVCAPTYGALP